MSVNTIQESLGTRLVRVWKANGPAGFIKKGWGAFWRLFIPLNALVYPYANWKMPRDIKKRFTAEEVVDYSLNRFWGFIKPSQVRSEIVELAEIAEKLKPKIVVEVGTSKGGTLFIWARLAAPDAHLVSIDLPGGENTWAYARWKEAFYLKFASPHQRIDLLRGDSQKPAMVTELQKALHDNPIDFLFIDADHSYKGVKKDYELYSPLVRKGGVIAFHDVAKHPPITGSGVERFWNEAKQGQKFKELIEDKNQGWAGIGVIFK